MDMEDFISVIYRQPISCMFVSPVFDTDSYMLLKAIATSRRLSGRRRY